MQEVDLLPVQVIILTVVDICIPAIKYKVCQNNWASYSQINIVKNENFSLLYSIKLCP